MACKKNHMQTFTETWPNIWKAIKYRKSGWRNRTKSSSSGNGFGAEKLKSTENKHTPMAEHISSTKH